MIVDFNQLHIAKQGCFELYPAFLLVKFILYNHRRWEVFNEPAIILISRTHHVGESYNTTLTVIITYSQLSVMNFNEYWKE